MRSGVKNIVVVGSLNMDVVVRVPKIPSPGETLLGGFIKTFPGGKGANQAVAAARLGAQVTLVGKVGDDPFGKQLLHWEDAIQAGVILLRRGVKSVVLTLGEKEALILEGGPDQPEYLYLPAYQVQAVNSTAAGDSFVGALATGLGERLTLQVAAAFASAAAAISVTRPDAQPSLPKRDEVHWFLQERTLPL